MDGDQLQHIISDEEFCTMNKVGDAHHNEDTCTGHTPDVWICHNPECGDKLTADTIGRDGAGPDDGSGSTLFCTSCSSRDVRLVTPNESMPKLHPHQQEILDRMRASPAQRLAIWWRPKSA